MNWDDIRIALALYRKQTLSAAATSLRVTHTTVRRRISSLEKDLGVRLFDRTPDGFFVTTAGEEIVAAAQSMEDTIQSSQRKVLGADIDLKGALRLSTLDFLFVACRQSFVNFIAEYPSIALTITTELEPVSLNHGEADIVLRLSPAPPEGLVGRRVGRMSFSIFASKELVDKIGTNASYASYPWLGMSHGLDNRWLDSWMKKHAPGAKVCVRVGEDSVLTRQLVLAGVGVFFLPRWEGLSLGLIPINARSESSVVDVWLLTHKDLRHTSRVRAFMEFMGNQIPMENAIDKV